MSIGGALGAAVTASSYPSIELFRPLPVMKDYALRGSTWDAAAAPNKPLGDFLSAKLLLGGEAPELMLLWLSTSTVLTST